MSNSLGPYQVRTECGAPIRSGQNVGPDLGQNCLQMLSADDMSDILMQKVKYNGFDPELSEPKELPKEF